MNHFEGGKKSIFFLFFYLSTFRPSSQSLDTPGHSNRKKKASQIGTSVTLFFYSLLSGIDQKIKEKKKRIDTQKKNLMRKSILLPMTCLFSLPFYGRSRALNGMLIHLTPIEDSFFFVVVCFSCYKRIIFWKKTVRKKKREKLKNEQVSPSTEMFLCPPPRVLSTTPPCSSSSLNRNVFLLPSLTRGLNVVELSGNPILWWWTIETFSGPCLFLLIVSNRFFFSFSLSRSLFSLSSD